MKALSNHHSDQRGLGRPLQKSAILGAGLALLLLIVNVQLVHATSITVNTTDDELNADGDCSLREAIHAANTNAAVDACPAGEPVPTIDIITFGVTGMITLASTLPSISEDVTIDGPGATSLTISGGHTVRVMSVEAGATLNLEGVTVADGAAPLFGGVFAAAGILNLGTLNITNSTFSGGSAQDYAGAIGNFSATLTITGSTLSGNFAQQGGAIWSDGSVTIMGSTLAANSADAGGAIYNVGSLTITDSTFSGNSATGPGGAMNVTGGLPILTNSTFSENSAAAGGAINAFNNRVVTLRNTIVANSLSGGNCSGVPIADGGGNLQYPGTDCGATIASADPLLDSSGLQDNGGPTKTIALQPGSPAIDSAVAANCSATDQRGVTRPQGAACDIGAYELEQAPADTTAPTIAITTPANGETYLLGQMVLADYACADEAGGSGLAACGGTVPNGSAIDTASVGTKIFTVDAADNAGNMNSASVSYNVIYSFDGFFPPVDNQPTLNIAKAGQTIPIKWRITDAGGVPVTNLSSVTVTAVGLACEQGTTIDQLEEYTNGSSGLQNLGDGYYQFNWKTPKSYANSCKTFKLNLGEGLVHELLFAFTK